MTLKNIFLIVLFSMVENSLQNPYVRRISRQTSSIIHSRTYREPAPEIRSYERGPQILTNYRDVPEHQHRYNFERQPQDANNTFNMPSVLERREINKEFGNQPLPHHNNERTIQSATEVYNTEYKTGDTGKTETESGYQYNLPPKNFNHYKPYPEQQQPALNRPGHNTGYQIFDNNLNQSPTTTRSMTTEISRKKPDQNELRPKDVLVYQNVPDQSKSTVQPYNSNDNEHLLYITTSRNTHDNVHEGDKKSENSTQNWLSKKQAQNVTDGNTDNIVNNIVNTKTNMTVTIDNRDSFNGGCPDGYKRVNGVCVMPD